MTEILPGWAQGISTAFPNARLESVAFDGEIAPLLRFEIQRKRHVLLCTVQKSEVDPLDVPRLVSRLRHFRASLVEKGLPVVVAPHVSSGAREQLIKKGVGWFDFAGNGDLQFADLFLKIRGNENPCLNRKDSPLLFSPKASRMVHALLLNPKKIWNTLDLKRVTGVSIGLISGIRHTLVEKGWASSEYGKLRLDNPKELLDEWASRYDPKRAVVRLFTYHNLQDVEQRLQSLPKVALTEFSAADRYAPYTRYQRIAFYVPRWEADYAKELDLKPGDGAASNVTAYESEEGLLMAEEHHGARCASPILTYLDLMKLGGRGVDAAEHLYERTILPRWQ